MHALSISMHALSEAPHASYMLPHALSEAKPLSPGRNRACSVAMFKTQGRWFVYMFVQVGLGALALYGFPFLLGYTLALRAR